MPPLSIAVCRSCLDVCLTHTGDAMNVQQEPASFTIGRSFSTSVLPGTWAIRQLAETLEVTQGQIEHQYAVLERLAEVADFEPQQAVRCLRLMANVDRQDV